MFKVGGATVFPTEVEAALRTIPSVAQAFVTNVADGDGVDRVGALVVPRPSEAPDDLVAAARARLSSFKVPTSWLVVGSVDEVPMSATGKVDKRALQDLLRTRGGPAPG
jgi:acyl-CoA synthetase (AMP-forming)/AMP-acid ligase II